MCVFLRWQLGLRLHPRSLALSPPFLAHSCSAKVRARCNESESENVEKRSTEAGKLCGGRIPSRNSPANIYDTDLSHVFTRKNRLKLLRASTHFRWHILILSSRCNEKYEHIHIQYWMTQVAVDRRCPAAALFHSRSVHIGQSPCQAVRARALIGVNLFEKPIVASLVTRTREQIYVCTRRSNAISRWLEATFQ